MNVSKDIIDALSKLDCGSNSCRFAEDKTGQRFNSGCNCLSNLSTELRIALEKEWVYETQSQ